MSSRDREEVEIWFHHPLIYKFNGSSPILHYKPLFEKNSSLHKKNKPFTLQSRHSRSVNLLKTLVLGIVESSLLVTSEDDNGVDERTEEGKPDEDNDKKSDEATCAVIDDGNDADDKADGLDKEHA